MGIVHLEPRGSSSSARSTVGCTVRGNTGQVAVLKTAKGEISRLVTGFKLLILTGGRKIRMVLTSRCGCVGLISSKRVVGGSRRFKGCVSFFPLKKSIAKLALRKFGCSLSRCHLAATSDKLAIDGRVIDRGTGIACRSKALLVVVSQSWTYHNGATLTRGG